MNIVDIAAGDDDFDLLTRALGAANLTGVIEDLDDVTVFAPTDAALAALATQFGYAGPASDEDAIYDALVAGLEDLGGGDFITPLTEILLYHLAEGTLDLDDIAARTSIPTLLDGIAISPDGTALGDLDPDLPDPVIVRGNIEADNGIVHGIDGVLLPVDLPQPPVIADILAGADFDILQQALVLAGLTQTVSNLTDVTIFAPTDAAFLATAQALGFDGAGEDAAFAYLVDAVTLLARGGDPAAFLTDILEHHIYPGRLDADAVLAASELSSVAGTSIDVVGGSLVDADPDLPDAPLLDGSTAAKNGIVHPIGGVLLPLDILPSDGANAVDFLIGDDTGEVFDLGPDADWAYGKGGADRFLGGAGDDVMLGGAGLDTAAFDGASGRYGVQLTAEGITVVDKSGAGTDFLVDMERLEFADGLALGAEGALDVSTLLGASEIVQGDMFRLIETYIAYFDRAPDAVGLLFWANAFADGVSIERIADLFFTQPESDAKLPDEFGALVDTAYQNLLERGPDPAGREFWVSVLESGAVTPGQFMLELIRGARANDDAQDDVATVVGKSLIANDYALREGLTDVENAEAVLAGYDRSDFGASVEAGRALVDQFAAAAAEGTDEFTVQLVGLLDESSA